MKPIAAAFLFLVFLSSCKNRNNSPDVSGIKVDIRIERFDRDFFSMDTMQLAESLKKLQQQHPFFYTDFMQQLLGVSGADTDQPTLQITREFFRGYLPVYNSLSKNFENIIWLQKDLQKAFQYVKYYFPDYKTGNTVLFVGPFDAPGVALTQSGLAVGLQQFAGKDFPAYRSMEFQRLFPEYISRRFEPHFIVAACMKAVIEDLFPDRSAGNGLIEQMIEKGKRWWLLDKFLPATPDSLKTGYTRQQLDWCSSNEGQIWSSIILNEKNLHAKEPEVIQKYIGEAPFTQAFSPASPGNVGQWVGWQIVKKFAEKNSSMKVDEIMKTEPGKILEEAKYKPK